jgi:hypothetical protein
VHPRLVPCRRTPGVPLWALGLSALWGSGVVVLRLLVPEDGSRSSPCLFRHVTGLPCPTCGGTRAAEGFLHGDVGAAFSWNPLLSTFAVLALAVLVCRVATGRSPTLGLGARGRRTAWIATAVLFFGNWAYLLARGV